MQGSARWKWIAIWLAAAIIAALSCGLTFPAAHLNGEYVPVGNDSFYHARRILDAVRDPGGFYEIDQRIHALEGSVLTWPWGYDYFMAKLVHRPGARHCLRSDDGYMSMARVYSFLIYLAPVTFGLCLFQCWRDRSTPRLLLWITAVLGLAPTTSS